MATCLFSHISGDINEQIYYILFISNVLNINKVEAQGVLYQCFGLERGHRKLENRIENKCKGIIIMIAMRLACLMLLKFMYCMSCCHMGNIAESMGIYGCEIFGYSERIL